VFLSFCSIFCKYTTEEIAPSTVDDGDSKVKTRSPSSHQPIDAPTMPAHVRDHPRILSAEAHPGAKDAPDNDKDNL
jgi:hypothetical protein